MIEVMEGGGVFWYAHQRAYCSALKSWQSYINAAIDMFFTKETLAASCAMGNEKKSSNGAGHQPLNAAIIQSLFGELNFTLLWNIKFWILKVLDLILAS